MTPSFLIDQMLIPIPKEFILSDNDKNRSRPGTYREENGFTIWTPPADPKSHEEKYCEYYHIAPELAPILTKLKKEYWYLFHVHDTIQKEGERYTEIKTGWYTHVGANAKRVIVTDIVCNAVRNSGFRFRSFNVNARKGAKGERIRIFF